MYDLMNRITSSIVIWLLTNTAVLAVNLNRKSGPFYFEIHELKTSDDNGADLAKFTTKINSVGNGKHIYNGSMFLGVPIDEHFKTQVELQQWGNGGYRPRSFVHTFNGCKNVFKYAGRIITNFLRSGGIDIKGCPVPVLNNIDIRNWNVGLFEVENINAMPYNKYRAIIQILYKNVKVGCGKLNVEIVPK